MDEAWELWEAHADSLMTPHEVGNQIYIQKQKRQSNIEQHMKKEKALISKQNAAIYN